jgi:hypothetical protein
MSDEQHVDGDENEAVEYETPAVEDLGTTEGPTVTSAGATQQ